MIIHIGQEITFQKLPVNSLFTTTESFPFLSCTQIKLTDRHSFAVVSFFEVFDIKESSQLKDFLKLLPLEEPKQIINYQDKLIVFNNYYVRYNLESINNVIPVRIHLIIESTRYRASNYCHYSNFFVKPITLIEL